MANKKPAKKSKTAASTNTKGRNPSKKSGTTRSTTTKGRKRTRNHSSDSESDEEPHHAHHTRASTKRVKHVVEEVEVLETELTPEEIPSEDDSSDVGNEDKNSNNEASQFIVLPINLTLPILQGEPTGHHRANTPDKLAVKADLSRDILTIFSDRLSVKFKSNQHEIETLKGRWCQVCK
jgi:hypothetical protein